MDFRKKIIFGFTFLIFGNWGFGQLDTSDFSFYSEPDSVQYGPNAEELNVSFTYSDISQYEKIVVELILVESGSSMAGVYYAEFNCAELENSELNVDGTVTISLGIFSHEVSYELVVRVIDDLGHQVVNLSKNIAL